VGVEPLGPLESLQAVDPNPALNPPKSLKNDYCYARNTMRPEASFHEPGQVYGSRRWMDGKSLALVCGDMEHRRRDRIIAELGSLFQCHGRGLQNPYSSVRFRPAPPTFRPVNPTQIKGLSRLSHPSFGRVFAASNMPDFAPKWQMSGENVSKRCTERWTAVHPPTEPPRPGCPLVRPRYRRPRGGAACRP
jgi:hypothetical protein